MMSDDRIYSDFISSHNLTEGGNLAFRKSEQIIGLTGPLTYIDMEFGAENLHNLEGRSLLLFSK